MSVDICVLKNSFKATCHMLKDKYETRWKISKIGLNTILNEADELKFASWIKECGKDRFLIDKH